MGSLYRLCANAVGRMRSLCALTVLMLAFIALAPSPANAISEDEAIDFVVEAAARGGQALGISVPEEAKDLLKELVKCAAHGTPVADCAKQSVINTILKG